MIISSKYKFIFLKPLQVGGTAVELALKPHLGRHDILTPQVPYDETRDSKYYNHKGKNSWNWFANKYFNHMDAQEFLKVDKPKYEHFSKVTIVRDPIDLAISLFEHEKTQIDKKLSPEPWQRYGSLSKWVKQNSGFRWRHSKLERKLYEDIDAGRSHLKTVLANKDFFDFAESIPQRWNQYTYAYVNGMKVCRDEDYLRFENLEEEFVEFTKRYNIPYDTSTSLIHTKAQDIAHDKFFVNTLITYVKNHPLILAQNGGPKSREELGLALAGKIKRSVAVIHDNSLKISTDFGYQKFSEQKIDDIVRKYLNQFPDKPY